MDTSDYIAMLLAAVEHLWALLAAYRPGQSRGQSGRLRTFAERRRRLASRRANSGNRVVLKRPGGQAPSLRCSSATARQTMSDSTVIRVETAASTGEISQWMLLYIFTGKVSVCTLEMK